MLSNSNQDESPSYAPNGVTLIYGTQDGRRSALATVSIIVAGITTAQERPRTTTASPTPTPTSPAPTPVQTGPGRRIAPTYRRRLSLSCWRSKTSASTCPSYRRGGS